MKAQKNHNVRILAILFPALFVFVMFSTSLGEPDTFYYMGWSDVQNHYFRTVCRNIRYGDNWSNSPPLINDYELADSFRYDDLANAGFTHTFTHILDDTFLVDSIYHGIKVFNETWKYISRFKNANYTFFDVGGDSAFFNEPNESNAGANCYYADAYGDTVFKSLRGLHTEGFLIDDSLWVHYQRMNGRDYHLEIKARIWDPDQIENPVDICSVYFGGKKDTTIDIDAFILNTDSMAENVWDTVRFTNDSLDLRDLKTVVRIKWLDHVNLMIDWIRIFDAQYDSLAINVSQAVWDSIKYEGDLWAHYNNNNIVEGFISPEPWPCNYDALEMIHDTLSRPDVAGMGIFTIANPWHINFAREYAERFEPDILPFDIYTLEPTHSHYSDAGDVSYPPYLYTLQAGWDSLIHRERLHLDPNYEENRWYHGLRSYANLMDSLDIQWFNIYWSGDEYGYKGKDASGQFEWIHMYRAPTENEMFCGNYMALCYGAQGVGYYLTPPFFSGYTPPPEITMDYFLIRPHQENEGCVSIDGLFDLYNDDDDEIAEQGDFPDVVHEGYLLPNSTYYTIDSLHAEFDLIDSILLKLDWDTSFCTNYQNTYKTSYEYIDTLWTSEDDSVSPPDSTFIQVGVFNPPPASAPWEEWLMVVNRRCLEDESRKINVRVNVGMEYASKCFKIVYYVAGDTILDVSDYWHFNIPFYPGLDNNLAPGHGELIKIFSGYDPGKKTIETEQQLDWLAGDTIIVADTIEVEGTLKIHPGAYIKLCNCIDGILVKPGGHLSVIGKPDSLITIEGVSDTADCQIKLWGSGQDTIMYCNIRNLKQGVGFGVGRTVVMEQVNISKCNTGVFSVGGGALYMDNCTVDSCTGEGIYLGSDDIGYITNCTIRDNGEAGVRLHEVQPEFELGYNIIEGNNTDKDSSYEAVHFYKCSPIVYQNFIQNNEQDGVGVYHDSYPEFNITPNKEDGALNKLTGNNDANIGNHIYLNESSLVVHDGHNDIFNGGNDTTTLIAGVKVEFPGNEYKLYGNYYGDWEEEPNWAFDLDCKYSWEPRDDTPNIQEWEPDELAEAFDEAIELEFDGLYARAINAYVGVVTDYPTSSLALASLDRMLGCYQAMNGNLPILQMLYEGITDTTENEFLLRKARLMAIRCLTSRRQYDQAITRLEDILLSPSLTFTDSIYTLIDIANVHMQAYYDSLICSWDSTCDPVSGLRSAGHNNRRAPQSQANLDMIQGNPYKTANNQRTSPSAVNDKKARTPSGNSEKSHTSMNFTQAVNTNRPQLNLGGTYVMERASYPMNYITKYRPENDRDYQHRVKSLMVLLRKGESHPRVFSPPPIPDEYFLAQNYPNPFNPITTIRYGLPEASHVNITIYNILGREVMSLVNEHKQAGYYNALWDSKSHQGIEVSSGVYFYRIKANDFIDVKKMVLLR